jgi:integrase
MAKRKLPKNVFFQHGTYYYRVRKKLPDGTTTASREKLGQTQKEMRDRLKLVLSRKADLFDGLMKVGSAVEEWLNTYVRTQRNPRVAKLTRQRAEHYLLGYFGAKRLRDITRAGLRSYRVWLHEQAHRGKPLSPQTVSHILADARCFLNWAVDNEILAASPWPRRLMPKVQETIPRALEEETVKVLLKNLRDPHLFAVRLALATGLRWSELCRCQAAHLTTDGWLEVQMTKSAKVRRIPLGETDPTLAREIRRRVGRLVPFSDKSVGGFSRLVRRHTGLPAFSMHMLRHTFATRWLNGGGSIVALQDVMGHSDIKLTQRYAKVTADFVRAEARRQADAR